MMREAAAAMVVVLGTLCGTAVRADPVQREAYVTWLEDRYTESWGWLLRDATVAGTGTPWRMEVKVQVRDHGRAIREPAPTFVLTTESLRQGYLSCPSVGIIADGQALQGIVSQWSHGPDGGKAMMSVSFSVPFDTFRRIAGAKVLEARLCTDEVALDGSALGSLRGLAAAVEKGPPSPADRKRYLDQQALHDFADNWKPRDVLRGAWRALAGEEVFTYAGGANAQVFRVASSKCGQGMLGKMTGTDTPPLVAAGFHRIECVGGAQTESRDL
jgi:hypothetical protein